MQWLNEPANWQRTGDMLRVSVDPGTDFWRATGYGYIHDSGHVYGELLPADLDISVRVRGSFASQYDQAGIMLRADDQTWLKTGVEFFEGRPRLSTVLTLGWSSWIVADLPAGTDEVAMRVSRRGEAVEVRYTTGTGPAELAALVFLPPARELLAGICCAAPEGGGFTVNFHELRIAGRDWAAGSGDWAAEPPGAAAGWEGEPPVPATGWAGGQAAASPPGWSAEQPARPAGTGDSPAQVRADDETGPARPAASGETGPDGKQPAPGGATGTQPGGKAGGRGKAKARPAAAEPADAADEWISLLTADPADEPPDAGHSVT